MNYRITTDHIKGLKENRWYSIQLGFGGFIDDVGGFEDVPEGMVKVKVTDCETGESGSIYADESSFKS